MQISFKDVLKFTVEDDGKTWLSEFMGKECRKPPETQPVQLQCSGENWNAHHNNKYLGTNPGSQLRYASHSENGDEFCLTMSAEGMEVQLCYKSYEGAVRCFTVLKNTGEKVLETEYLSSFFITGIEGDAAWDKKDTWEKNSRLHIPHNTWTGELQWRSYRVEELGINNFRASSLKRISYTSNGTWSTGEYLPMGLYEDDETGEFLFWQIENNGPWYWEIGDDWGYLYLQLSGPTERENHWHKSLKPGESFTSVPVCVGRAKSFDESMGILTSYRRAIRRKNEDNENLPVIFNDYMNCLFGDPTTEKLLPLIDAASNAGCEYFCIDAGWYADGEWWNDVGEWQPSKRRFPGGITEVTDYIAKKGMKLGLWLEIEVIGINSPTLKRAKQDWFFTRHGKPVIDHGRYQLDFRNPEVRDFADEIIDRLVGQYGAEYIKMDYNINGGIGTELNSDSLGDGLLEHNRAYLVWLDKVFARYPKLVIENCSSGGLRMEYAMLSRHSIQSTSDQTDYKRYAMIAANCTSACCPEQAAIWSYPLMDGDREETIFNMVNALLFRVHQSGHLAKLSPERFALVKEGIDLYKQIRGEIKTGLPFYPLGICQNYRQEHLATGLACNNRKFLSLWQLGENEHMEIPLSPEFNIKSAAQIYPAGEAVKFELKGNTLHVYMKKNTARLFELL